MVLSRDVSHDMLVCSSGAEKYSFFQIMSDFLAGVGQEMGPVAPWVPMGTHWPAEWGGKRPGMPGCLGPVCLANILP